MPHAPIKITARTQDGSFVELELDAVAMAQLKDGLAGVRVPLVGYKALRDALAKVNIRKSLQTLMEWQGRGKLPSRRVNGRRTFYLDEVLERIGGRV